MTKDVGILMLGLLVALMPFLGFPGSIERIVFVISGFAIAILAFFIRGDFGGSEQETDSFVQNGGRNVLDGTVEREKVDGHEAEEKNNE